MHLLQFIKALSTGIYCHLASAGTGRPLGSLAVSYKTHCSLRLFDFHIFTSHSCLKDNNPRAESMEQYRFMLRSTRRENSRPSVLFITRVTGFSLHSNCIKNQKGVWRFWLMGNNASALNQNPHLPFCPGTWKEKQWEKKKGLSDSFWWASIAGREGG